MSEQFEPKIVGFMCNWCSYRAADLAGTARIKYSPDVRIIRVMCSGRVDPTFVMKAFSLGADGVMMAGCHPGECHYIEQNYKAMRRFAMIQHTLTALGIEPARFRLVWASAAEGSNWPRPSMRSSRTCGSWGRSTGRETWRKTAITWPRLRKSPTSTKR